MADPLPTYEMLQQELAAARAELHALRWLLPAARLLRRARAEPAATPVVAPAAQPDISPMTEPPPAPPSRATGVRGVAMAAYRLARPVMRPVAWRSRSFLTGQVMAELQDHRAKLDLLLQRSGHGVLDPGVASAAERALLTLALESRQG